jgi:hypothetical protein
LLLINTTNANYAVLLVRATSNGRCRLISRQGQRHCRALLSRASWPA